MSATYMTMIKRVSAFRGWEGLSNDIRAKLHVLDSVIVRKYSGINTPLDAENMFEGVAAKY